MLDKVKLALRLSGTALDGEVSDLINAAIADLRLVGINIPAEAGSSSKTLGDPLLDRAVVLYAKAEFGFNDDAERYRNTQPNTLRTCIVTIIALLDRKSVV